MSVSEQLLNKKLKLQERAVKADERAQQNIIAKMQLEPGILQERDPNVLKAQIIREITAMDNMLREYDGLQKVTQKQDEATRGIKRVESAAKDTLLNQLQKELDELNKQQREALNRQRDQIQEVEKFQFELIDSKKQRGQKVVQHFKEHNTTKQRTRTYLTEQQKVIDKLSLEEAYRFYKSMQTSQYKPGEFERRKQQLDTEYNQLFEGFAQATQATTQKDLELGEEIRRKQREMQQRAAEIDGLNKDIETLDGYSSHLIKQKDRKDHIEKLRTLGIKYIGEKIVQEQDQGVQTRSAISQNQDEVDHTNSKLPAPEIK